MNEIQIPLYTRRWPRYPTTFVICADGWAIESRGNVGVGGFCFEADDTMSTGSQIDLLFRLPGAGIWLKGSGTVLGCTKKDNHICIRGQFTHIEKGTPDMLDHWLRTFFENTTDNPNECPPSQSHDLNEITLFTKTV